jgi:hypothetical protein
MSHPVNPSESTDDRGLLATASSVDFGLASALVGDAGARPGEHTLTVRGVEVPAKYRFRVSGTVTTESRADDPVEIVNENTVLGTAATPEETEFRFSGRLVSVRVLDGDVAVSVDGEDVTVPLPAERSLANTATLRAEGDVVDYRFRVSDRVERGPLVEPKGGHVEGSVVEGTLGGQSVHNYFYAGSFELEHASGPLTLTLDVNDVG